MRQAIVLMAKAPRAGDVKTRLCPPLSHQEAATLYRCFLLDSIAKISQITGATPVLSYSPADARQVFETLAPGWHLIPQIEGDLGHRMATAMDQLLGQGYRSVLLTGSDLPTLPAQFFRQALTLLGQPKTDLVLGPSEDGGYYLIGLQTLYLDLFNDMTWSTPQVFDDTLCRADRLGLTVATLPTWYDIDTPADLTRLRRIAQNDSTPHLHYTQQFFVDRSDL